MKYIKTFMGSVPALAGILLVILTLVNLILVQDEFLNYTNQKYDVHKRLMMSESELEKVTDTMISYVKGKTDSPQITVAIKGEETEFFNQKEIGHLKDVRTLVKNIYIAMIVLAVIFVAGEIFLARKRQWKIIRNGMLLAWGIIFLMAVLIGIIAVIDINTVVTGFHRTFLSESKWVLNPALDRSVRMFTMKMYIDVIKVLGIIVITVFVCTVHSTVWICKRKMKQENGV